MQNPIEVKQIVGEKYTSSLTKDEGRSTLQDCTAGRRCYNHTLVLTELKK